MKLSARSAFSFFFFISFSFFSAVSLSRPLYLTLSKQRNTRSEPYLYTHNDCRKLSQKYLSIWVCNHIYWLPFENQYLWQMPNKTEQSFCYTALTKITWEKISRNIMNCLSIDKWQFKNFISALSSQELACLFLQILRCTDNGAVSICCYFYIYLSHICIHGKYCAVFPQSFRPAIIYFGK